MPNNIDSLTSNFSCLQYQSQQSTFANLQCQQQENPTQPASTKNEQVISDTKPYTSPSSDTLKKTSRPIKKIPCEYSECDKTFPTKGRLKEHHRSHTGEKPYKCDVCDNFFTSRSNLKVHRRIHTGEKPYKCDVCDNSFTTRYSLKVHQIRHTGEKPYKCTICEKAFPYSSSVYQHIRSFHARKKPHKCTDCGRAFSQKGNLNRHKQTHTRKKTYKCTICHKVFNRIGNLNKHFKKNHINNNPIPNFIPQGVENPQNIECKQQDSIDDITPDNQIREIIKNCNASKKNILNSSYNSIVKQCQDKYISIEETLMNIFSILDKKYMLNDDAQNVAKKLVSIITQLPPQFKSTSCLDIRDDEKIKTYTEIAFILKNHTVDEFLEKYLKIDILQSGDNQDLSTKKRTRSDSLNDDETILGKKIKSADEIKIELGSELTLDNDGLQITSTSKFVQAHNNALPILHAPGDDTKDLMPESENTKLKISMWGDNLQAIFATMPQDEQKQAKQSIIQQCNDWVSLNRDKREEYAKNLDDSLEITIPIIDEVERGTSVFAKKPFKIFDVIGPYSGALYTNQKDLNNRMRKQGTSNVMEFLFNTISKNRSIDGTQGGNTLSYINTGQLLDYPKIAENNLAIIYAGKNLSFYVAIKPIAQGEELFIDYGLNYTGREQIKVEAE